MRSKVLFQSIFEDDFYIKFEEDVTKKFNLPIKYSQSFIGFGKINSMYRFWITNDSFDFIFNCRIKLNKSLRDNRVRILFKKENKDEIFKHIEQICEDLLNNTTNTKMFSNNKKDIDISSNPIYLRFDNLMFNLKTFLGGQINNFQLPTNQISNRLYNCLGGNGIFTFNDLILFDTKDIINFNYFGRTSLRELIGLIEEFLKINNVDIIDEKNYFENVQLKYNNIEIKEKILYDKKFNNLDDQIITDIQYKSDKIIEIIDLICQDLIPTREYDIYYQYCLSEDNRTLQDIGNEYSLTRERIRQIVNKVKRKQFQKFNFFKNIKLKNEVINIFNSVENENFLDFIKFGFLINYSEKKTKHYLSFIFEEDFIIKIIDICTYSLMDLTNKKENIKGLISDKVIYPSNFKSNLIFENINSVSESKYIYINAAYKKFKEQPNINDVIINPDICYYEKDINLYYPDFALKIGENIVLVILLNTINLGFYYNRNRFNKLHEFCKHHGFGYLILDTKFVSIFEIKEMEIDKNLEIEMLSILDTKKLINWEDILLLKKKYKVSKETIVSFVLNNKFRFSLKPFCIKKGHL